MFGKKEKGTTGEGEFKNNLPTPPLTTTPVEQSVVETFCTSLPVAAPPPPTLLPPTAGAIPISLRTDESSVYRVHLRGDYCAKFERRILSSPQKIPQG